MMMKVSDNYSAALNDLQARINWLVPKNKSGVGRCLQQWRRAHKPGNNNTVASVTPYSRSFRHHWARGRSS